MERIEKTEDFKHCKGLKLHRFLQKKASAWMEEYNVTHLSDIGCFIILEESELDYLMNRMLEFIEIIQVEDETYLHTVLLINDNFGEDIYLRISRGVVYADT